MYSTFFGECSSLKRLWYLRQWDFKVIWKANIVEFFNYIFSLNICHLIWAKINCMTLTIRSKTDSKSKSQNIWQQIILFSSTVMQMIYAWLKIWNLSGRFSPMRNVQLMITNIYIFRVYSIGIIATTKICSHGIIQTDSSIIIVRNECVLTSASMIVYLLFTRSWSAIIGPKLFFTRLWPAIIGTKQPKVNQSPQ